MIIKALKANVYSPIQQKLTGFNPGHTVFTARYELGLRIQLKLKFVYNIYIV